MVLAGLALASHWPSAVSVKRLDVWVTTQAASSAGIGGGEAAAGCRQFGKSGERAQEGPGMSVRGHCTSTNTRCWVSF